MSGYVQSSAISEGHAVLGCLHPDSCNKKSVWNMRHMPRVPHTLWFLSVTSTHVPQSLHIGLNSYATGGKTG